MDPASQRPAYRALAAAAFGLLLASACGAKTPAPTSSAAKPRPPSEAELGKVTLTPEAEQRLGIPEGLHTLARSSVPARRLLPGEVMPVPGRSLMVVAPIAGTVGSAEGGPLAAPGAAVKAGQLLATLTPLLGPTERLQASSALIDADAQVARAQVQEEAATLQLSRVEKLVADNIAGERQLDDARAAWETAKATLAAAKSQRESLVGGTAGRTSILAPARITAPFSGTLRDVRVTLRQQVLAGTPLMELVDSNILWVRVAVPSVEIDRMSADGAALISELGAERDATSVLAPPVRPPPVTGQPTQSTVDLYFALSGSARFRPGQRVAAWVPLAGDESAVMVPSSAVVFDTSGGTWVYENTAPQVFVRRRVEMVRTEGALSVIGPRSLQTGALAVGARIVTGGAMELFGSEFGVAK